MDSHEWKCYSQLRKFCSYLSLTTYPIPHFVLGIFVCVLSTLLESHPFEGRGHFWFIIAFPIESVLRPQRHKELINMNENELYICSFKHPHSAISLLCFEKLCFTKKIVLWSSVMTTSFLGLYLLLNLVIIQFFPHPQGNFGNIYTAPFHYNIM